MGEGGRLKLGEEIRDWAGGVLEGRGLLGSGRVEGWNVGVGGVGGWEVGAGRWEAGGGGRSRRWKGGWRVGDEVGE